MPYWNSTFSNLLTCKISSKNKKTLNLGPKFLFQHETFNYHPPICETIKFLWVGMLKIYSHICNQHPSICLIRMFPAKIRILQLGNKNTIFGCFRQQLLYFHSWCWNADVWCKKWYIFEFGNNKYCHIWNQQPRICLTAKLCEKIKMPKFCTKSTLFGYFWTRILKKYCHIWNQHPQICLFAKLREKNKNA